VSPGTASVTAVAELAALHGVETSYAGADGRQHQADEDVLLAILAAMGTTVTSAAQAATALAEASAARAARLLEPVLVHRVGTPARAAVTLPGDMRPHDVWCTVELEDGQVRRQRLLSAITGMRAGPDVAGAAGRRYQFGLEPDAGDPIGAGYHRLTIEWPGVELRALVISAPTFLPATRGWGAFLPLHALRTERDWGIGSYVDMAELGEWIGTLGGSMLGALPLYPAFLDPPADPSPYLPVSRLAYNEIFVDPTALPELAASPEATRLLESDEFTRRLAAAHASTLVDYEEVVRLRREVLAPMAETLLATDSPRRKEFCAFIDDHPELAAYAQFRAVGDRLGRRAAEELSRLGTPPSREPTLSYHLYAQWVAAQQLDAVAAAAPLYADLPIGVHPEGFDPTWAPGSFVPGVHGGAPPDLFFSGGQDWAFPPWHPQGVREDEYRYLRGTLRRAFQHASYLRVDHVMGLQRLYWIPPGFDARHGAYVSYRAEELHALVALEAFRAGAVVVGEDLGTVPEETRLRMAEDKMLRSWVLQFESTAADPLPPSPSPVLASWATHDLPRFSAYFVGDDIDENEQAGQISPDEAEVERVQRAQWRASLLHAIGAPADVVADPTAATTLALQACLDHLAASEADLVLIDLEELWGERQPQNHPGTGTDVGNWRRRAAYTLEEIRREAGLTGALRQIDGLRRAGVAPTTVGVTR
jgi:4-alpha-glucanotransferase